MNRYRGNVAILWAVAIALMSSPVCFSLEGQPEEKRSTEIEETLRNMWGLAQAGEAHLIDFGRYPRAYTIDEYATVVRNLYLGNDVPLEDAWGYKFLVTSDGEDIEIRSVGSDGIFEEATPGGMMPTLEADIVIRNRRWTDFFQYPREYCDLCPPDFCCTTEQIEEKVKAGLTEDEIRADCKTLAPSNPS